MQERPRQKLTAPPNLHSALWEAANILRGSAVDRTDWKGYILPLRYGIDKRKAHLSNLILNGEITREQALAELQQPTDDPERQQQDKHYVAKKLGWSDAEFDAILAQPPVPHAAFGTDATQRKLADLTIRVLQPFAKMGRRLMGIGK